MRERSIGAGEGRGEHSVAASCGRRERAEKEGRPAAACLLSNSQCRRASPAAFAQTALAEHLSVFLNRPRGSVLAGAIQVLWCQFACLQCGILMVLGPFSPDRRRPAAGLIEAARATTPWANDQQTSANAATTCRGLTDDNDSPAALKKIFDMVDSSVDVSRSLMIPHPTDRPPETQRESSQTSQKSLQRVLAQASELTPPKTSLNDILSDSPGTAASPETLGVIRNWNPNFVSAYSPWLVSSPSELSVLSPRGDSDTGYCALSYDASNDWPADDSQDVSPAYDLRNTYTHTACPERIDNGCDYPPLYDKSKWRSFEICVNPPNATYACKCSNRALR